eukprot:4355019-Alexandrium_andersonii.AAC.1
MRGFGVPPSVVIWGGNDTARRVPPKTWPLKAEPQVGLRPQIKNRLRDLLRPSSLSRPAASLWGKIP